MTQEKDRKSSEASPFQSDLERDPGIGQSKGAFATGADADELEGVNTAEGDIENDTDAEGGVPDRGGLGRTNK